MSLSQHTYFPRSCKTIFSLCSCPESVVVSLLSLAVQRQEGVKKISLNKDDLIGTVKSSELE